MFKTLLITLSCKTTLCYFFVQEIKSQQQRIGVKVTDDFQNEVLVAFFFPGIPIFIMGIFGCIMLWGLVSSFSPSEEK